MGNGLKLFKANPLSSAYEPLFNPTISVEAEHESVRVFSFKELKKGMKKLRQERIVECEDCSIRKFYKGYINETTFALARTKTSIPVSVVECFHNIPQTLQKWKEQVKKSQSDISHPNLVKLLGYCCEDDESLFLVFEYSHKGSLDRLIFGKKEEVLPWDIRVKIAIGTVQGLVFLHSTKHTFLLIELRMQYIMLDEQYNAKLLYLEPNHQRLVEGKCRIEGGFEYFALEFAATGLLGMQADVYTFGVVLLELFSGLKASDTRWNQDKQNLAFWAKFFLSDNYNISEIIDPRLGSNYPLNAATQMCTLIKRCIELDRTKRRSMQQIYVALKDICTD